MQRIGCTTLGILLLCACTPTTSDSIASNKSAAQIVDELFMLSIPSNEDDLYNAADALVRSIVQRQSPTRLLDVYRICESKLKSQSLNPKQRVILHQTQVVILFYLASPEAKDGCALLIDLKNDPNLRFDGEMGFNLKTAMKECSRGQM